MTQTTKQGERDPEALEPYLQALQGLGLETEALRLRRMPKGGWKPAACLRLVGPWGKADWDCEIRTRVARENLGVVLALMKRLQQAKPRVLLLTQYVTPPLAEDLRREGVPFVDAAGNAYLEDKGLYVWVTNRRPPRIAARDRQGIHAAGLKLLRLILRGNAIYGAHRALAGQAGIALGGVGRLLREFERRGWIRRTGPDQLEVQDGAAMLRAWDDGYAVTLRPKLMLRTCRRRPGQELERLAKMAATREWAGRVLVGGELGAAMLTHHLRPTTAALHVDAANAPDVMRQFGLLPDPEGDVFLLRNFGNTDPDMQRVEFEGATIADPLLVRAELLVHPDDRLRETAEIIRTKHITVRGA
jgi:hypothetical protein